MDILSKLDGLDAKFHEVGLQLTDPVVIADQQRYVRLNKEYHELERVLKAAAEYRKIRRNYDDAKQVLIDEKDPELKELARAEIESLEPLLPKAEEQVKLLLLPRDKEDDKDIVLEI